MLLASLFLGIVGGCSREPQTIYAPQYTEQKFGLVRSGDESNRVVELIGLPLDTELQTYSEKWMYGVSKGTSSSRGLLFTEGVLPSAALVLYFGADGLVKDGYGKGSAPFKGKDRGAVQAALGFPAETVTNKYFLRYNYTRAAHSGSFEIRAVDFNEQGRVLEKWSVHYRD